MSKDLNSTKQHLDELKTYKRLDRVKEVIDKDTEWTLLHHSANQNSIQILQDLVDTGVFNINQKDTVSSSLGDSFS
jgi:predicted transcriptional regulator YheO